jgi:phosphatidyl-myo-inositol dimannoside synthase
LGLGRIWMVAPCLHYPEQGGIQRCGHSAWEWLKGASPSSQLVSYGPTCQEDCHQSKAATALAAAAYANWADPVLVWHQSLLKLTSLTWRRSRKLAVLLHGIEAWDPLNPADQSWFERVNLICTVSDYTWRRFTAANPRFANKPHETIHLGFAHQELPHTAPDPQTPAAVIIARMNRLEDYKGHRQLIECWPLVQRQIPKAELWIIGGGDLEADLKQIAGPNIKFLGRLPEADKLARIQRARCLAMPSRGEGFGLVYLEAMRAGRPCLVSNQDAGQEVINPPEAGLAIDPADIPACAQAVTRLLSDGPEWKQWSANAKRRYTEQFTEAAYHRRLAAALQRLEAM